MLVVASAAGAADGLCRRDEHVVFACRIGTTAKQVALCASQPFPAADAALAYRFGRPGHVELAFPSEPRGSLQRFRHAHYFRYQVDRSEASFDNDGITYTVFDHYDGDEKPVHRRGVRVSAADGRETELLCRGPVVSDLQRLEGVVPCDADNALSDCRAPEPVP